MPQLPTNINGVRIENLTSSNHEVSPRLLSTLKQLFRVDMAGQTTLTKVTLKTDNKTSLSSDRSIEIVGINGLLLSSHYPANPSVKNIVDNLQANFESMLGRHENFGPSVTTKMGNNHFVPGFTNSVILSVL